MVHGVAESRNHGGRAQGQKWQGSRDAKSTPAVHLGPLPSSPSGVVSECLLENVCEAALA